MLLAEIGAGMNQFPSSRQLASWAGLCPGNCESAGKRLSSKTRKGSLMLRRYCRSILRTPVLIGRSTAKWESSAMVVSGNADQFGEGLSILSITITSTSALAD